MGEDAVEASFERELRDLLPTAFADGAEVSGEWTIPSVPDVRLADDGRARRRGIEDDDERTTARRRGRRRGEEDDGERKRRPREEGGREEKVTTRRR